MQQQQQQQQPTYKQYCILKYTKYTYLYIYIERMIYTYYIHIVMKLCTPTIQVSNEGISLSPATWKQKFNA